jgi:mono/diheme cytochrome c family protein
VLILLVLSCNRMRDQDRVDPGDLPEGLQPAIDPPVRETAMLPVSRGDSELARGAEAYGIYCAPCHGADGEGEGRIVERGYPDPGSLRGTTKPVETVIRDGIGRMLGYGDRIDPEDRHAIARWVHTLGGAR